MLREGVHQGEDQRRLGRWLVGVEKEPLWGWHKARGWALVWPLWHVNSELPGKLSACQSNGRRPQLSSSPKTPSATMSSATWRNVFTYVSTLLEPLRTCPLGVLETIHWQGN